MSDTSAPPAAQGANGDQAGQPAGQGAQGAQQQGTQQPQSQAQGAGAPQGQAQGATRYTSLEEATAAIEQRERENAQYRERLRAFEAAEQERQRATMGETERLQADLQSRDSRINELTEQLRERDLRDSTVEVAERLGFRNPRLASRLVDRTSAFTADGQADTAAIERQLAAALEADPYLGSGGMGDGAAGRTPQRAGSMDAFIRTEARRG